MTPLNETALLEALADGDWHSGEVLAERFGVSRAAIWKRLKGLERLPGITLEKVSGRGYRLCTPLELLDEEAIRVRLNPSRGERLQALELLLETDSTNQRARQLAPPMLHTGSAVLAEYQTAGRGRRGRQWVAPFGGSLCLSLAWRFDLPLAALSGLSLVAGVVLARVLAEAGLDGHCLKWPNDLLVDGRKLAGILVEASGEAAGPCTAVIGIGLNLKMDPALASCIDQPWSDLHRHLADPPSRNRLAGDLLDGLLQACIDYGQMGLEPFLEDWRRWDGFAGRPVVIHDHAGRSMAGTCRGVDERGGLLLDTGEALRTFHSGEVSLREGSHG